MWAGGMGSPCLAPGHRYQQGPCAGADNVTERQAEGLRHPTPHPLCPMTRVWGDTGLRSLGPNRVCSTRLTATVRNPQAPVPPAPPATLAPSRQQPAAKPGRVLARPHLADAAARPSGPRHRAEGSAVQLPSSPQPGHRRSPQRVGSAPARLPPNAPAARQLAEALTVSGRVPRHSQVSRSHWMSSP